MDEQPPHRDLRPPWSRTDRTVPRRLVRPLQQFLHQEIAGGLVLLAATVAALIWANADPGGYLDLWTTEVTVSVGDFVVVEDLKHLVNDGLMAIFFLVVGLEVKRELVVGELSGRQAALLPFFAALGGMVVPAAIFIAIVLAGGGDVNGWGIPMATDVAFALGALAALGSRVPTGLVALLLGVAVIDDIGAILVVAVYYTGSLQFAWLATAVVALAAIAALGRLGVRYLPVYVALALVAWFATLESGVHATIAGVAIGLLTPVRPFQDPAAVGVEARRVAEAAGRGEREVDAMGWLRLAWLSREAVSPLIRVEHGLHQWSSFVVLPLFALANAGIPLDGDSIRAATETPVALAVAAGLLAGKTLGLAAGTLLAVRLGLSALPRGVGWTHIVGVAALAGIGFTVSLFITELAYDDEAVIAAAKIGVLAGSALAAVLGIALLARAGRARRR
ncbi:Na+/H+ antiporter NhaA [Miltoncostaea marina]|uniref:Na+/H+ antiporter NhaA n=1 Tax=Miltoncostaea marina TaxID=2843215 RepID=UPI001C3E227A|nr:Na+/H+ antiporter NhaA [Miltoncostaea marina]